MQWDGTGQLMWSIDMLCTKIRKVVSLKLKTKHSKSSTNAELFAIDDDAMDFVEWIQLFVEQHTKPS